MPEICAIVENWEASILGQNFFSVLPFAAKPRAGLHGNIEKAELFAGLDGTSVAAGDNTIPR